MRREYFITLGRLEGAGRRAKPLKAGYILEYRNPKLAVIEAKAWDEKVSAGLGQAKDYAIKLAIRFAYATNGQGNYAVDMSTGKERGELGSYQSQPDSDGRESFRRDHGKVNVAGFWRPSQIRMISTHCAASFTRWKMR